MTSQFPSHIVVIHAQCIVSMLQLKADRNVTKIDQSLAGFGTAEYLN